MTTSQLHQLFLKSDGICTDTRKIKNNVIFFALKGERFNGNTYAKKAIEDGASFAVIDEHEYKLSDQYILVSDVLKTLQDLASHHRAHLNIPIIALTGSNGKTTTKELINNVLSSRLKTTATVGNLNNHIGVPLTLLSMTKDTEIGIVEMGANHIGEIDFLCSIAKPDYGYITNIGKAHLEGFGSIEGVLKGKTELYNHLKKHQKLVFINIDDKKLLDASSGLNKYSFSQTGESDITIQVQDNKPNVSVSYQNTTIHSNLIGAYNFTNIAAAITIGNYFKVNKEDIKKAIENYTPSNNRSQIIQKNNYTIIMDAYNANPTSMEAAIKNFKTLESKYKIAFLGDMFELGNDATIEHQRIVDQIIDAQINEIYLIGNNFYKTKHRNDSHVQKYMSFTDLENSLRIKNKECAILIKGSRGMQLERILDLL